MSTIKEEIHALSEEMLTNLGKLVAIDSQLAPAKEGMPFVFINNHNIYP